VGFGGGGGAGALKNVLNKVFYQGLFTIT